VKAPVYGDVLYQFRENMEVLNQMDSGEMENIQAAMKHLSDLIDGWEIAADCERRIMASYEPEMRRWDARQVEWRALTLEERGDWKHDDNLTRMVRNALDARSNARRFDKDATAVRTILEEINRLQGEAA
jgi:hypothetical protein